MAAALTQASVGGFVFADSITLAATAGYTQSHDATYSNSISLAATANAITNLNYPESITIASSQGIFPGQFYVKSVSFAATSGMTMSDSFLWNPTSDTTTTWTKVDYPN